MTRWLRILAAAAVLLGSAGALQAQNTAAQESRRAALQKEIAQLEQQLKENSAKSSNALNELTLVRKQISTRRSLVTESEAEVKRLADSIAVRQAEADRLLSVDHAAHVVGKLVRFVHQPQIVLP